MPALTTPVCAFGAPAIEFKLPDVYNKIWNLEQSRGPNGLLIMFICNHCPYVQAILPELVKTTDYIKNYGINTVAIMSNDWLTYTDDSPEKMLELQQQYNFNFPYLIDETQEIAKKYDAVCTPDFFGYNSKLELQYRGRLDARGKNRINNENNINELEEAMLLIAKTDNGPQIQHPSIGCSIKWRD